MKQYKDRKKAFLGALIGAGVSILGSAINSGISSKKQNQELEYQRKLADIQESAQKMQAGVQTAQNLTEYYADSYNRNKEFKDRFYKCGGRKKTKCGGRKKAKLGAEDTAAIINSIGNTANSIMTNALSPSIGNISAQVAIEHPELIYGKQAGSFKSNANNSTATYDNNDNIFSSVQFVTNQNKAFRCGGRKKR